MCGIFDTVTEASKLNKWIMQKKLKYKTNSNTETLLIKFYTKWKELPSILLEQIIPFNTKT